MSIVLDLETAPHPAAADFIPKPDLDAIQPAGNLKDPAKVAASIAERKQAALDAYQESLGRAALDWNVSRIVCLGWHVSGHPEPIARLARDEAEETASLIEFWGQVRANHDEIIGFSARNFDVPTLIQRSRLLNVSYPVISLARWGKGDVTDLRDALTFDDARYEALMPRTLKNFARRFGIPVPDETNGRDVPVLIAAGDWEGVRSHCLSDIDITRQLAIRIGLLKGWPVQ